MNFRRRLSSIVTPFTGSQAVQSGTLVEPRYVNEKSGHGEDELTSPSDDSSRKSYDLSDAASKRSFDKSDAGSDAASDDDSSQALSGSDDSWDAEEEESEVGDKYDLMASHLYQIAEGKGWFRSSKAWGNSTGIVSIRVRRRECRTYPNRKSKQKHSMAMRDALRDWEQAICLLNPQVALRISSKVVQAIMARADPNAHEIVIDVNTRIQVVEEVSHLAGARKHQCAAFIRSENCLSVWTDEVETVIQSAEALEQRMIHYVWAGRHTETKMVHEMMYSAPAIGNTEQSFAGGGPDEKDAGIVEEDVGRSKGIRNWIKESLFDRNHTTLPIVGHKSESQPPPDDEDGADAEDSEMAALKRHWRSRPVMMYEALLVGFSCILILLLTSLGYRILIKEYVLDGKPLRFLLMIVGPLIIPLMTFSAASAIGSIWQILGPINQVARNSCTYSAIAPKRTLGELPHVTVWLPVYKEGLEDVIMPTVESLKVAQATYERQGGSVSILVCDDGLQLISPEDVEERRDFYHNNSIAYVARPGHGVNGFERRGRFKKASNMNFAIQLSLRVEEILDEMRPTAQMAVGEDYYWSDEDEKFLYGTALSQAIAESEGVAWAEGNIRIGAVILIIDSDTRVPEDCFIDAVSEFEQSPEVAILQHSSGVMQVAHHFFENGIAHFTHGIQLAISFCCAGGTMGPFVGHNAFLRWSALQEIIFEEDGVRKVWSESHVSEDFAISLALQLKGYIVRWVTYSNDKFEEGVSLTCDDEVNRWQKYAWGCSELIFNPLRYWITRGPLSPLCKQYLWSDISLAGKISVLGYIFSYYAIGFAWPLTVVNFVLIGFGIEIDGYYLNGWKVTFTCLVLFPGLGNLAAVILRYRLKVADCGQFAQNQVIYLLFFSIFFSGLSMQILFALVCHMIGYQMSWATTLKTVETSNFFKEVPDILRKFKITLTANFLIIAAMIITSTSLVPIGWRVSNIEAIVPMAMVAGSHLLYPIVLNPWLAHFSF